MEKMAARVSQDEFFLGNLLAEFKALHQMDDAQLAGFLECEIKDLDILSLCRRPTTGGERFPSDVRRIADFANCNADQLVRLMREVTSLRALRVSIAADNTSLLAAARDATAKAEDEETDG